jgi:hypothetical protein
MRIRVIIRCCVGVFFSFILLLPFWLLRCVKFGPNDAPGIR